MILGELHYLLRLLILKGTEHVLSTTRDWPLITGGAILFLFCVNYPTLWKPLMALFIIHPSIKATPLHIIYTGVRNNKLPDRDKSDFEIRKTFHYIPHSNLPILCIQTCYRISRPRVWGHRVSFVKFGKDIRLGMCKHARTYTTVILSQFLP